VTCSSLSTSSMVSRCALFLTAYCWVAKVHVLSREPHSLRHCSSALSSSRSRSSTCCTWHRPEKVMLIASGRETGFSIYGRGCPITVSDSSSSTGRVVSAPARSRRGSVSAACSSGVVSPLGAATAPAGEPAPRTRELASRVGSTVEPWAPSIAGVPWPPGP
jgi:hypothetical protein